MKQKSYKGMYREKLQLITISWNWSYIENTHPHRRHCHRRSGTAVADIAQYIANIAQLVITQYLVDVMQSP